MFTALAWLLLWTPPAVVQPADRAAALFESGWGKLDGYIQHFRRTGDGTSKLPDLDTAAGEFAESARLYLAGGRTGEAAFSLVRQADCRRIQQRWAEALSIYETAIRLARQAGHPGYLAKALIGAAKVESLGQRNYGASLKRLEEAIRLSAPLEDKAFYLDALEEKADVETSRGDMPAAAVTLGHVLEMAADLKDETRLAYVHYARGDIYFQMATECAPRWQQNPALCREAIDRATTHLASAQRLANRLGYLGLAKLWNEDGSLEVLRRIAGTLERLSETAKARVFEPEVPSDVVVNEMFVAAGEAGDESCQQFKRIGESVYAGRETARSLSGRGQMELICGRKDAALAWFRKSIDQLEKDRRNVPDESGRGTFLQDKTAVYELPAALLLERHDYAEAFDLLERFRSSVLADLLATRTLGLTDAKERALYADATKLRAEIGFQQKGLFEKDSAPDREQHAAAIAAHQARLAELETRYQRLMNRMGQEAPRLKELTASRPVTLEHLQGILRRERLEVLYYLVRDTDLILLHIGPEEVHARVVFVPRPALVQKVEELRESLRDRHAKFNERRAHQLFLYLVRPALEWLKSDSLVIVAHDALHYVPFQVLFDRATKTFVGERFRISYAPSATILAGLRSLENLAGGRLFAAADPGLQDARQEVEAIAGLYPGRHKLVTGALVTETDVKKYTGGSHVVHLAVHGEFNAREPLLSGLKLAKSASDDGLLTAAEMFGLPLEQAALVVFSACESGRLQASRANEILGIVRALLYAGAQSLLLTSWKVDSAATSLWMQTFYREAQSKPPREAARLALLALKNHPSYSQPFYWGPFLLVGR